MNPLFNKNNAPKNTINFSQMRNGVLDYIKQQVQMGVNPNVLIEQILQRNPQLKSMIQKQYGNMSYQEIAKQNGYNVQDDLSQLGL